MLALLLLAVEAVMTTPSPTPLSLSSSDHFYTLADIRFNMRFIKLINYKSSNLLDLKKMVVIQLYCSVILFGIWPKSKEARKKLKKPDPSGQRLMNFSAFGFSSRSPFPLASQRHQSKLAHAWGRVRVRGVRVKRGRDTVWALCRPCYRAHSVGVTRQCSWPFTTIQH